MSYFRSPNTPIIATSIALAASVSGCRSPEAAGEEKKGILELRIEREISKHHRAVVELLKRKVRFEKNLQSDIENMRKLGIGDIDASYDPVRNVLTVNESENANNAMRSIDAVDHEIAHATFDELYQRKSEETSPNDLNFSGPSLEELTKYCTNRVKEPEFEKIRALQDIQILYERGIADMNIFGALHKFITDHMKSIIYSPDFTENMKKAEEGMSASEWDQVQKDIKALRKRWSDYLKITITTYDEYSAKRKAIIGDHPTKASVEESFGVLSTLVLLVRSHEEMTREADRLKTLLANAIEKTYQMEFRVQYREYERKIAELEVRLARENDPSSAEHLRDIIEIEKRAKNTMISTCEIDTIGRTMDRQVTAAQREAVDSKIETIEKIKKINEKLIHNTLNDPNEIFARMVDSLMSVYFGPTEQNSFPLTEDDLKFLLQFKANGESIYEDAVEKYRIGMQLIAQGKSPEEVRRLLEHAKTLQHDGKVWVWDRSTFTFTEAIPRSR